MSVLPLLFVVLAASVTRGEAPDSEEDYTSLDLDLIMPSVWIYMNHSSMIWTNDETIIIVYAVKTVIDEVLESLQVSAQLTYDIELADVFVNYRKDPDDDPAANKQLHAFSVWPMFHQEFCFVYAASKRLSIYESMNRTSSDADIFYIIVPVIITSIYHALILRFQLHKTVMDAITRGPLYALQIHLSNAMPNFDRFPHYK